MKIEVKVTVDGIKKTTPHISSEFSKKKNLSKLAPGKVLMPKFALSMKSYVDRMSQKYMF